jgi:hypothetical protein
MQTESRINKFICFYAEVQLIFALSKDNANRVQNKMNSFIFYAEAQLIFASSKDNANRVQNKQIYLFLCRGAAYLHVKQR